MWASGARAATPEYGFRVLQTYPHDRTAFTEGLFYLDNFLYEGTGLEGHSDVRKVSLVSGDVIQRSPLPGQYFGEGIVAWGDRLYQLTYRHQVGFVYDKTTLRKLGEFPVQGQGWALTTDGVRLYMDGTRDVNATAGAAELRILDPRTLRETGSIHVTDQGRPVENLNELEWVKGEIFANVWQTNRIARINPKTGVVTGWIDLTGLLSQKETQAADVLNGIAYDHEHDRLFVTGKFWPKVFQIRLVRKNLRR
ncbi:MAG: glutamine cyclotransferase [Bryobacterales bacterium]|jgi:glutamine cyclotransferase|nr:glutamine cyclotransferase [Bryobacterales bacterium]